MHMCYLIIKIYLNNMKNSMSTWMKKKKKNTFLFLFSFTFLLSLSSVCIFFLHLSLSQKKKKNSMSFLNQYLRHRSVSSSSSLFKKFLTLQSFNPLILISDQSCFVVGGIHKFKRCCWDSICWLKSLVLN